MCMLFWTAIKVLTDLHIHSCHVHQRSHIPTGQNTDANILLTPNIIPMFAIPKSAGVFPHAASKRQRLRDQRLPWLCSSARLLSTLMQMCARQSGRKAGRHACGVWVTIDPPTIHISGKLLSRCSTLSVYQSLLSLSLP